ncbi:hypothetical protein ABVT39_001261 [Epinephelus coioides]
MEGLLEEEEEEEEEELSWTSEEEEEDHDDHGAQVPGLGLGGLDAGFYLQAPGVVLYLAPQAEDDGGGQVEWGCESGDSPPLIFDSDESPPPPYESLPLFYLLADALEEEVEGCGAATPPMYGVDPMVVRDHESPSNMGSYTSETEQELEGLLIRWFDVMLAEEEEEDEDEAVDMELCGSSSSSSYESYVNGLAPPVYSPPSDVTSDMGSSRDTESTVIEYVLL